MLSKANRIDNGEVIGRLLELPDEESFYMASLDPNEWMAYEIDPFTLKHSFDNGETWYTEDEIKQALEVSTKDTNETCKECEGFGDIDTSVLYHENGAEHHGSYKCPSCGGTGQHVAILPDDIKLCEDCKWCMEDNNDTDVWIECKKKDSPMEHTSLLSDYGYPDIIKFSCSEHEPK